MKSRLQQLEAFIHQSHDNGEMRGIKLIAIYIGRKDAQELHNELHSQLQYSNPYPPKPEDPFMIYMDIPIYRVVEKLSNHLHAAYEFRP